MNHLDIDLCKSSEIGDIDRVRSLLEAGVSAHACDSCALSLSSQHGHVSVVKLLLDAGADVHAWNSEPLMLSAQNGHVKVVKLLIDAGANVSALDSSPLCNSSSRGHAEVVKLLLAAGADVHARDSYSLVISSRNGHIEVVKLLLARGAVWSGYGIPHELKPSIRTLLGATFTLRRWVRSRLMRLRLRKIVLVHRLCIELQHSPPRGSFKGGVKYIESQERFMVKLCF